MYYFHQNSAPFLSGDVFAAAADLLFYEDSKGIHFQGKTRLDEAKVIFCTGDSFRRVLAQFKGSINPSVIIVGNSDEDFSEMDFDLPRKTKRLFLQNSTISDQRITSIPIGIENLRLGKNGLPKLFKPDPSVTLGRERILFGPFSPTHSSRKQLTSISNLDSDLFRIQHNPVSTQEFAKLCFESVAIVSPRGNGLDTHRTWESLYRGSYPIVIRNRMTESFVRIGIPLIEIVEWGELAKLTPKSIEHCSPFNPESIPALWWPFWKHQIQSQIN